MPQNAPTAPRLGPEVTDFTPPPLPNGAVIEDRWVRLEPLAPAHAPDLFAAFDGHDALWDYIPNGPHRSVDDLSAWVRQVIVAPDPVFFAIVTPDGKAKGQCSFLRIDRTNGVIEIGFIVLSPDLQGSREGSAALMATIRWAFQSGYRRVEWKCNALNAPSRRAALRFGFSYEGTFRQHLIVKGRNRDTAWYAIIDTDWPALDDAYETWLSSANFDASGRQRRKLSDLTEAALPGRADGVVAQP